MDIDIRDVRYKTILEQLSAAVYVCDGEGRITFFNHAAEQLWGYRPEALDTLKKFCACYKVWSLDGTFIPPEKTPMAVAIERQSSVKDVEAIVERPDGSRIFASVSIDPLFDDMGKFIGAINIMQNVDDRKANVLRLIEGGKALEDIIDTIPSTIWITDENAHCTFLNRRWYEYTGQTKEEALGLGWLSATHPDDREDAAKIFLEAYQRKEPFTLLYRLRTASGDYRWNVDSGAPRFNRSGNFEGYIGSVIDVHVEQVATGKISEARQELQETLQKLRMATESADVGTWSLNVRTGKLDWSNIHKRLWGYDDRRDDLTYEHWHQIILEEDKHGALEKVAVAEKQKTQYENLYRIRRAIDGVIRWMRSVGQYFYDEFGKPVTLTGISIDITDQKTVEKRFRSLSETLPQLVWMTDARGNFVYASGKWMEYSNIDPKTDGAWEKVIHPDDEVKVMQAWQTCLRTGSSFVVEARLRDKNGNYRWHFGKGEPLRRDDHSITNWIGAYSDIHEQRTHQDHLEKLVAARTYELAQVNQQLERKNLELERSNLDLQQFAHVASHDLKEPLRKIQLFADRIAIDEATSLSNQSKSYLDKIVRSAGRLTRLIDGVLGYSTIGADLSMEHTVDLNEILKSVISDLEVPINLKEAHIELASLPTVRGSNVLLSQMFYNLINNALKFSKPGERAFIEVTSSTDRAMEIICVSDQGIGFDQHHASSIFDTFTRLNPKDQYEGTGLGLSLCRKIAERHHGRIWAEGSPGQGSKFFVSLPRMSD